MRGGCCAAASAQAGLQAPRACLAAGCCAAAAACCQPLLKPLHAHPKTMHAYHLCQSWRMPCWPASLQTATLRSPLHRRSAQSGGCYWLCSMPDWQQQLGSAPGLPCSASCLHGWQPAPQPWLIRQPHVPAALPCPPTGGRGAAWPLPLKAGHPTRPRCARCGTAPRHWP